MYVIVVGCGRMGSDLTARLSRRGHAVTVVDFVGSSFQHLDPAYRGRTIEAESLGEGVLKRAGIEHAHALAAVTNSDAVNAVVAHVARIVFKVPNVVARNYDPRWRPLHEALGLQSVSSTVWGAQRFEEMLETPSLRSVFSAGNGEVEVYELHPGALVRSPGERTRRRARVLAGCAVGRGPRSHSHARLDADHRRHPSRGRHLRGRGRAAAPARWWEI